MASESVSGRTIEEEEEEESASLVLVLVRVLVAKARDLGVCRPGRENDAGAAAPPPWAVTAPSVAIWIEDEGAVTAPSAARAVTAPPPWAVTAPSAAIWIEDEGAVTRAPLVLAA